MAIILLVRECNGGFGEPMMYTDHRWDSSTLSLLAPYTYEGDPNACQPYSRPTDEVIHTSCSSTTYIEWYHNGTGGVTSTSTPDSPLCGAVLRHCNSLVEYYAGTDTPTGRTKENVSTDPDFIAPHEHPDCG